MNKHVFYCQSAPGLGEEKSFYLLLNKSNSNRDTQYFRIPEGGGFADIFLNDTGNNWELMRTVLHCINMCHLAGLHFTLTKSQKAKTSHETTSLSTQKGSGVMEV